MALEWKITSPSKSIPLFAGGTVASNTVFYDENCDRDYVRRSLIGHDGYPDDIKLRAVGHPNKFSYLHVLQGDYGFGHGWEDLACEDQADSGAFKRIRTTLREYRENEGGTYRLIQRREEA